MNILYCDGACRGNGGSDTIGAYAYIIEVDGKPTAYDTQILNGVTNNIAEYTAVLQGCMEAKRLNIDINMVVSDSQLIIRQLQGIYAINKEELKSLNNQIKLLLGNNVVFKWRSRNDDRLKQCDAACNAIMNSKV